MYRGRQDGEERCTEEDMTERCTEQDRTERCRQEDRTERCRQEDRTERCTQEDRTERYSPSSWCGCAQRYSPLCRPQPPPLGYVAGFSTLRADVTVPATSGRPT